MIFSSLQSSADQLRMILPLSIFQRFCISNPSHAPHFPYFLSALYSTDVIDSEEVFNWYKFNVARGAVADEGMTDDDVEGNKIKMRELWEKGGVFVKALAEAEEDESEEEESDEE